MRKREADSEIQGDPPTERPAEVLPLNLEIFPRSGLTSSHLFLPTANTF